jgi:hypothetical protein
MTDSGQPPDSVTPSPPIPPVTDPAVAAIVAQIIAVRTAIAALTPAELAALGSALSKQFGMGVDSLMHGEGPQPTP